MLLSVFLVLGICLIPAHSNPEGKPHSSPQFPANLALRTVKKKRKYIYIYPDYFAGTDFDNPFLQRCFEDAKKLVDDAYTYSRVEYVGLLVQEKVK